MNFYTLLSEIIQKNLVSLFFSFFAINFDNDSERREIKNIHIIRKNIVVVTQY